ncbi:lipid II:glycine glycyltransferase FemX [Streptomyces virginiae]|uniref:lipid II:glycine glycyltransferase FemX n=1 Tax=Streptomyces virginiae TaxID=1961 RepID=UPI00224FBD0A|nr:peptidoglycan bridge formation glycyltransferase FemA/FemB family protein [Streptomyces virginiae]MCX5277748.1 aminoacyltransferase [Streptomyces virginiae]
MAVAEAQMAERTSGFEIARTTVEQHRGYLSSLSGRTSVDQVSFLQLPSWAAVKEGWTAERLGWFDGSGRQHGAAQVLYRPLPGTRRYFAYLPEGPQLDWADPRLTDMLQLLLDHLRSAGAFAVRMGPPLPYRRWHASTLKTAVGPGRRVEDVVPDLVDPVGAAVGDRLRTAGWRRCGEEGGAGDAQPRYLFEVPLAGRSTDDLWSGLNQEWRRNIKKASKAGVETFLGTGDDVATFYELLQVTERRDGFRLGRSLDYFQRQYRELNAEEPGRMRLYLARHADEVLAAHTMIVAGRRVWYQTGSSADHRREVRPSNALQWRMIRDAHTLGALVYDMRGVPATLDPQERAFGLMRWKLGTGGEVVETLGEWELPLQGAVNKTLHRVMQAYLSRR